MKIYPKILLITLPLIVVSVLLTGIIAHAISRSAIRNVVEGSLALRLRQVMATLEHDLAGASGPDEQIRRAAMIYLKSIHFGRTGNVFVIDLKGRIIGHQDANIEEMDVGSRRWFALMKRARAGKVQFVLEGESHWGVYSYFEPWDWSCGPHRQPRPDRPDPGHVLSGCGSHSPADSRTLDDRTDICPDSRYRENQGRTVGNPYPHHHLR